MPTAELFLKVTARDWLSKLKLLFFA